jgi:hypothetical protein
MHLPIAECPQCRFTVEWATVDIQKFRCNNCHYLCGEKKLARLRLAHNRRIDANQLAERRYEEEVDDAVPTKK